MIMRHDHVKDGTQIYCKDAQRCLAKTQTCRETASTTAAFSNHPFASRMHP
jgi:hypothetical protein